MTNNHMRLLTEQELQSIYGGNIFTSIWNWIKKHLLCPTFNLYTRFKNTDTGIEKVSFGAIHADAIQRMGEQNEPHLLPQNCRQKNCNMGTPSCSLT